MGKLVGRGRLDDEVFLAVHDGPDVVESSSRTRGPAGSAATAL